MLLPDLSRLSTSVETHALTPAQAEVQDLLNNMSPRKLKAVLRKLAQMTTTALLRNGMHRKTDRPLLTSVHATGPGLGGALRSKIATATSEPAVAGGGGTIVNFEEKTKEENVSYGVGLVMLLTAVLGVKGVQTVLQAAIDWVVANDLGEGHDQ